MLARSPKDRLASAADARDALDPALALGGWDPGSISSPGPIASMSSGTIDPSLRPTIPMPKVRTSPTRIAIGTAVGSAMLLAGMAWWNQRVNEEAPPPRQVAQPSTPAAPVSLDSAKKLPPLAKPDTTKPKPPSTTEFDAPLSRLGAAILSKDLAKVRAAFPGMTDTQRNAFEAVFLRAGTRPLRVNAHHGLPVIAGSSASRSVRFDVLYQDQNSVAMTSVPMPYRATYEQRGGVWTLVSLISPQ
jgi:hypothetical protein